MTLTYTVGTDSLLFLLEVSYWNVFHIGFVKIVFHRSGPFCIFFQKNFCDISNLEAKENGKLHFLQAQLSYNELQAQKSLYAYIFFSISQWGLC